MNSDTGASRRHSSFQQPPTTNHQPPVVVFSMRIPLPSLFMPVADRLRRLHDAGVSIWLDFIERTMLRNGDLERRIRDESLTGMTSNPTIFEKALAEGSAYDDQIRTAPGDFTAMELFELIATTDVRDACDLFRGVYDKEHGTDGFVSIEVSPAAAHDLLNTVSEATRLWSTVDRPNVMVKVPGTVEGADAVRRLAAGGMNINITPLRSGEHNTAL